jgi:hypothetical protein
VSTEEFVCEKICSEFASGPLLPRPQLESPKDPELCFSCFKSSLPKAIFFSPRGPVSFPVGNTCDLSTGTITYPGFYRGIFPSSFPIACFSSIVFLCKALCFSCTLDRQVNPDSIEPPWISRANQGYVIECSMHLLPSAKSLPYPPLPSLDLLSPGISLPCYRGLLQVSPGV